MYFNIMGTADNIIYANTNKNRKIVHTSVLVYSLRKSTICPNYIFTTGTSYYVPCRTTKLLDQF